ncbi:MAG: hypothetical protein WAW39_17555 [Prosthecobacter sp.]|uniref:hypothetical protein n=1 Tax=Prosthecobacter sp. TaxID=1965333 RepID=UPI003BB2189C
MRSIKSSITVGSSITAGFCIVLVWTFFSSAFLKHASGKNGYGGFPTAGCKDLYKYLDRRGFIPDPVQHGTAKDKVQFHGSYHESRPFDVTIYTKIAGIKGVHVEIAYDFRGSAWSVKDSSTKAQEFAHTLCEWLTEYQKTRNLNAGL